MDGFETITFGERYAEVYDTLCARDDTAATVDLLEQLAQGGPALELAIGTGRVAIPLAARGLRVEGVEISPPMVKELRAKPGGDQIPVTMGDFADVPVDGRYRLIFVVFNTLFNLTTQDAQVRCFENVAAHLTDDGSFVVEAFVPDLSRFRNGQYADVEAVELDEVRLDVCRHDAVTQRMDESHVRLTRDGVRLYPVVTRYAWPSELDLMARIAGLRLLHRWSAWDRQPFTSDSAAHISVYGR